MTTDLPPKGGQSSPISGNALDHASLLRRFKAALKTAGGAGSASTTSAIPSARGRGRLARGIDAQWMGHRDYRTTLIYADYQPGEDECAMVDEAFA